MPRKKKTSFDRKSLIIKIVIAASFLVVAYVAYVYGVVTSADVNASVSKIGAVNQYRQDKLQLLFGTVKAAASGVKEDPIELADYYARHMTPALAAKLKQDGPSALFCSNKIPDDITFRPLNGTDNFVVNEDFFNGPGMEVTNSHAIIEFSHSAGYKDTDVAPDFSEKVSKVNCQ